MKKKVLFVITKSNWGGAQRYVYDLATALPKDQFEVKVIFGGTQEVGGSYGMLDTNLKIKAPEVQRIFVPSLIRDISIGKDIKSFFELLRLFKKLRPDIVHLNSSKAGGVGALAARFAGVPKIIFTVHGLPEDEARGVLARFSSSSQQD